MQTEQRRKRISWEKFREKLRAACDAAGGVRIWAEIKEVAPSTVYDTLKGLEPPPKILKAMKCRRVVECEEE